MSNSEPGVDDLVATPVKKQSKTRKGGKGIAKMPKPEVVKSTKRYQKTRGEHAKDIVIAVLITAVVAFIAGASYQSNQQEAIDSAVKSATVEATPVKK